MQTYQREQESVKRKTTIPLNNVTTDDITVQVVDGARLMEIAEEGLAAMFMEVGLEAMRQLFEQDVDTLVGPKGKHNEHRTASRHGTESTKVALNGGKISVQKPRVRSDGHDVQLPCLPFFQSEDAMNRTMLTSLLCGVSTRKFERIAAMEGAEITGVSKSEVSRRFNVELSKLMDEFFNRRLDKSYPSIMIDGMERGGMTIIVALGITSGGRKEILGLIEGGTENNIVVKQLFADLGERGLRMDEPRLFILDGSKALAKAVRDTYGDMALIQRCQIHKKRNVLAHLPESEQANIGLAISQAYLEYDYEIALDKLNGIASNLDHRYPDAAASMREGLEETLTVHKLEVPGLLRKTLSNTNAMESANATAASIVRRISKYQNGEMVLRHMAAGFIEAERGFRRVPGYKQIPSLINALYELTGVSEEQNGEVV
jgi:transposase-like protein